MKLNRFKDVLKKATGGIDSCPYCSEKRKEIIEHAKAGHPHEN